MYTFSNYVDTMKEEAAGIVDILRQLLDLSTFWMMERLASLFMEHEVIQSYKYI